MSPNPPPDRNRIVFFDTTLRDGEQSSRLHHAPPAKNSALPINLAALGVDILEAGFAIASTGDLRIHPRHRPRGPRQRASPRSPAANAKTSKPPPAPSNSPALKARIHIFLATSDLHLSKPSSATHPRPGPRAGRRIAVALACTLCPTDVEFSDRGRHPLRPRLPHPR